MRFLPTGDLCEPLADLVFFYIGEQLDWDAELAIPAGPSSRPGLVTFGQLGWTTWISPNWATDGSIPVRCAVSSRRAHEAEARSRRTKRLVEGETDGRYQS